MNIDERLEQGSKRYQEAFGDGLPWLFAYKDTGDREGDLERFTSLLESALGRGEMLTERDFVPADAPPDITIC